MFRRPEAVFAVVAMLVLLAGCKQEDNSIPPVEQQDRIVQTATLVGDDQLLITWDPAPCEQFNDVEVVLEEDFVNLRIRVTVDIENCPPPGITETTVDVGEPVGERKIWDEAFRNTVALES